MDRRSLSGIVVGTGPGRVHRPARRDRDRQGTGPRAGLPAGRRLDRRGAARCRRAHGRRRRRSPSCSCPPGRPIGSSSAPGPAASSCVGGHDPELAPGEWLVAVDLAGPRPGRRRSSAASAPASTWRPAWPPSASRDCAEARDARRRCRVSSPTTSRCRAASSRSRGRWHGRATPGEGPDRADAARRPAQHPRHRAGQLQRAVAGQRLPQRARVEPAGELPRREGGRRHRRLRRDVADGRRGPHHDLRDPSRRGGASGSANACSSNSWTSRSPASLAR